MPHASKWGKSYVGLSNATNVQTQFIPNEWRFMEKCPVKRFFPLFIWNNVWVKNLWSNNEASGSKLQKWHINPILLQRMTLQSSSDQKSWVSLYWLLISTNWFFSFMVFKRQSFDHDQFFGVFNQFFGFLSQLFGSDQLFWFFEAFFIMTN